MTVGDRLDQAMLKAGVRSQAKLSRLSGVPQATISRILSNQGVKGPETETTRRLAAACGVSFSWLIDGFGDGLVQPTVTLPIDPDLISGTAVMNLIACYLRAGPESRDKIMEFAKAQAKR